MSCDKPGPEKEHRTFKAPFISTSGMVEAVNATLMMWDDIEGISDLDAVKRSPLRPVLYEVWMLGEAEKLLLERRTPPQPAAELVVFNALLESFLIHVRSLADFLSDRKTPYDTDLAALQFVADKDQWKRTGERRACKFAKKHKRPISKWVAHLTEQRQEQPDKEWEILGISRDMEKLLTLFEEASEGELLPDELRALRASLQPLRDCHIADG